MFKMKAETRQKYGDNVQVVGVEPVTQMLDKLTEIVARRLERERQQLEQGAVEGEYRDWKRRDRVKAALSQRRRDGR
jgi:hypothetical protein